MAPPPSRLASLKSPFGTADTDPTTGLAVYHVTSPHVLVQASGYLKYALSRTVPVHILFRGQTELYPSLTPSLYRGSSTQKSKQSRDKALAAYLSDTGVARALRAVPLFAREPLLQHYGLRTKWLDVVDNVWVALWFACYEAAIAGHNSELLHFERREPRVPGKPFAYVVLLQADSGAVDRSQPGLYTGASTQLLDLRTAVPSFFLRPHAQNGLLIKRASQLTHTRIDYSDMIAGIIRVDLFRALDWLGAGSLLSVHSMFPPAKYDFGYERLLRFAPAGNRLIGSVYHVGA